MTILNSSDSIRLLDASIRRPNCDWTSGDVYSFTFNRSTVKAVTMQIPALKTYLGLHALTFTGTECKTRGQTLNWCFLFNREIASNEKSIT